MHMTENGDWLRARGIGRERFAGYVADYLTSVGYEVQRTDSTEPSESVVAARLIRMNPAVPQSAQVLKFRFYPTSGGAAAVWIIPESVAEADRARMDRFVREMVQHLERSVSTESHATAKVVAPPVPRMPWLPPTN